MELGQWAIIHETPSLLALIPLLVFIVLSFKKNVNLLFPVLCGVIVGWILTGNTPTTFGSQLIMALGSDLGMVGLLVMFAGGLGAVLNKTGISVTICKSIVGALGMKNNKQALLILMVCEFTLAFCLGSVGSAAAIILPILMPLLGGFQVTPVATTVATLLAGFSGMLSAPFCSYTQVGMKLTGLTYLQYLLCGGLPYTVILSISGYFVALFIQKKAVQEGAEPYPAESDMTEVDLHTNTRMKRITLIFVAIFAGTIIYAVIARKSLPFVLFVLLFLTAAAAFLSRMNFTDTVISFCGGCAQLIMVYFCMLLYKLIIVVIDAGGGFEALGNLMTGLCGDSLTPTTTMLLSTFVGAFGISGDNAAQMQIIQSIFLPMVESVGLNMKCWLVVLLSGSYLTNIIYPSGAILGILAMSNCRDTKNTMVGMWLSSAVVLVCCVIYAFIGPMLFA